MSSFLHLCQEEYGPVWKGEISDVTSQVKNVHTGCHLLIWCRISIPIIKQQDGHSPYNKKMLYFPRVLYPAAYGVGHVDFTSPTTEEPSKWIFLAGRNIDMLLCPKENCEVEAYILIKGEMKGPYTFYFTDPLCMELYTDKYLLVLTTSSLLIINIYNRNVVHTFDNLPRYGSLAVWNDQAVIWSRDDNCKVTLMLEEKKAQTPIHFSCNMDADETIRKATLDVCVTYAANGELKMYDASGKQVYSHHIGRHNAFMGIVSSNESRAVAVLINHPDKNGITVVFFSRQNQIMTRYLEGITSKNIILYRDSVYASFSEEYSTLERIDFTTPGSCISYTNRQDSGRWMKVSSTNGWLLEITTNDKENKTRFRVYLIQDHCTSAICSIQSTFSVGVLHPSHNFLPAFMYKYKGEIMVWKPGTTRTVSGVEKCELSLFQWDNIKETLSDLPINARCIEVSLPTSHETVKWCNCGSWIVLITGRRALILDQYGNPIADREKSYKYISLDDFSVTDKLDVTILDVVGFFDSLWIIWGQKKQDNQMLNTGVLFWDGKDVLLNMEWFSRTLVFCQAVATGRKSQPVSYGRPFSTYELIIKATDLQQKQCWKHISYDCNAKTIEEDFFAPDYKIKGALCFSCEPITGNVAFSFNSDLQTPAVAVYHPGRGVGTITTKFDIYFSSPDALKGTPKISHNDIRIIKYSTRFLWIITDQNFYLLKQDCLLETKVPEHTLPYIPLYQTGSNKVLREYQTPHSVLICPTSTLQEDQITAEQDDTAIFLSNSYIWRSDIRLSTFLRKTPSCLNQIANVVITAQNQMLVLNTHSNEIIQTQEEEDDGHVIFNNVIRNINVVITKVII